MNTEFYSIMVDEMHKRSMSIREFAKFTGISYASMIEFFNVDKPFRPLQSKNKARIHNTVGIPYDIIDEYNDYILKERKK